MTPPLDEIERHLHQAPHPEPPAGLRQQLINQIPVPNARPMPRGDGVAGSTWFRRWRLALATGVVAVVSIIALGVQQAEIRELNATIENLRQQLQAPSPFPAPATSTPPAGAPALAAENVAAEIEQLRARVARLTAEIAATEALATENQKLKAQLEAGLAPTPEEVAAIAAARERAKTIMCINNMKQLGLAARVWATDNADTFPPDTQSMSNEISNPKVLVCPSDEGRQVAASWPELTAANVSYEYLAPSAGDNEPQRVMFRCPIHGNVTLCDGSVQQGLAKTHPERFRTVDGKLYLDLAAGAFTEASQALRRRYGLDERGGVTPDGGSPQVAPADSGSVSEEHIKLLRERYGIVIPQASTNAAPAEPESEDQP